MRRIYHIKIFKMFQYIRRYRTSLCLIFIFFTGFALFLKINEVDIQLPSSSPLSNAAPQTDCKYFMPIVRFNGVTENDGKMDVVKKLFQSMGYRVYFNEIMDWDIFWSHTYPFPKLDREVAYLKPNQKINHFPGIGFLTKKNHLVTLDIDHIPKAFVLPNDRNLFFEFAAKNNDKLWISKNAAHRGMKLVTNVTRLVNIQGSFIQEFIKDPLLISGKKFDIGIYVMLTSIDPLRVYVYSGDILIRFCTQDYYPLKVHSPRSYIIADDYLPIWEVEDLKFYFSELNYTGKETLNAYLQSKGKRTDSIWSQMYETIQTLFLRSEDTLKTSTMALGNLRNFFELVRFDFILDKDLNVFLMEVNMSPNLSPAHFSENELLYSQLIYNSISLVGLVRKFPDSFVYRGEAEVSDKDIQVFSEQCSSQTCQSSCRSFKCSICNQCMTKEMKQVAKSAFLEFMNRGKYRRIFPSPIVEGEDYSMKDPQFSPMNAFMDLWFKGKCLDDKAWCQ